MAGRIPARLRVAGLAAACALLACAQAPEAPAGDPTWLVGPSGRPLLWKAEAARGGGTTYLLGSVHLGKSGVLDLGPAIQDAYDSADELVVEVDISAVTPEELDGLIEQYAFLPPPQTLHDVVSAGTLARFGEYAAERGMDVGPIERFKPWFLAQTLVIHELTQAGYDPELGIDRLLMNEASGHKPITGLETLDEQLALYDAVPADVQELLLLDTLNRAPQIARETEELIGIWERGDAARLYEVVFAPLEQDPKLESFYDLVYFGRNRAMAARLAKMAGDGRTRFVVVGAGHMVGRRGIPAELARRGYRVSRVAPQAARR